MRFKAEVEFSIDNDRSCWVYFPNAAFNLSNKSEGNSIIRTNVIKWFEKQRRLNSIPSLERIVADDNLPEPIRIAAKVELEKLHAAGDFKG